MMVAQPAFTRPSHTNTLLSSLILARSPDVSLSLWGEYREKPPPFTSLAIRGRPKNTQHIGATVDVITLVFDKCAEKCLFEFN
jgi:hypothetical protein